MKALVTGGGGFLGLAIVRGLLAHDVAVRSFSRHDHPELRQMGVERCLGDLTDGEAVASAAAGCELVYHAAAKAGVWGEYEDFHQINVIGTQNVVAACRKHEIPRLIYTSSPSVVFDGKDMEGVNESVPYPRHYEAHYPRTKAAAEQHVLAANGPRLATVALRPHLIWGPGDNHLLPRLAARSRAGQLRRIGRRQSLIDTVYIDNAAEAHLLAADQLRPGSPAAGKAYFISQGEPIETWEMIDLLLKAAGAPPVGHSVPKGMAMLLAYGFEAAHRIFRRPGEPRLTRFVVQELTTAHWFDIGAARRDFGYRPNISLQEGLRRLALSFSKVANTSKPSDGNP